MTQQWHLIRLRTEKGLSRAEMAKILNISDSAYAMKERGDTQFKQDEMFLLKFFFGLPMEEIFLPRNSTNNAILRKESAKCGTSEV